MPEGGRGAHTPAHTNGATHARFLWFGRGVWVLDRSAQRSLCDRPQAHELHEPWRLHWRGMREGRLRSRQWGSCRRPRAVGGCVPAAVEALPPPPPALSCITLSQGHTGLRATWCDVGGRPITIRTIQMTLKCWRHLLLHSHLAGLTCGQCGRTLRPVCPGGTSPPGSPGPLRLQRTGRGEQGMLESKLKGFSLHTLPLPSCRAHVQHQLACDARSPTQWQECMLSAGGHSPPP